MEYGVENRDVIMLLHGGGLSWWTYREVAELLQDRYHVILPVIDGHAQSDQEFISIENNATELIAYIDQRYNGSVLLIGGLSLGAQIVVEMLSQRCDLCRYAIVESALVLPMKLTHWLVKPMIEMSYGLIRQDWFSALQFKALGIKSNLRVEYERDTRHITKENMISFLKANSCYVVKPEIRNTKAKAFIFVGQKEQPKLIRSARVLKKMIASSVLEVKMRMRHGEFSINCAREYANKVISIVEQKETHVSSC